VTTTSALPPECSKLNLRVVEVPRLSAEESASDQTVAATRGRMIPAVAMVHAGDRALVCAWLRAQPHGRAAVLVGGVDSGGGADEGPLAFPAGARALPISPAQCTDALARFDHWERADLSLDCVDINSAVPAGPQLEDLFALLPDRPMGLLVVGRPLRRTAVQSRLDALSDVVDALESTRSGRGFERLRLARAEAELAYLERLAPQGFWELEFWTAGASAAEARAMAALIGGSSDIAGIPLAIRAAESVDPDADGLEWRPTQVVGGDCVAALARPPQRELPGIRVADLPLFDLTPEVTGEITLGRVLDATRVPSVTFAVPLDSVNRHVFVTGATGSGKSQTVRAMLEGLSIAKIPWMVIEPAKAEYGRMAGRVAGHGPVVVIRPGVGGEPPASLNPLEPSSIKVGSSRVTFPLQTHLDLVRALFTASFQAEEPFPQILAAALIRSYEELGWNLALGRSIQGDATIPPRYPTLSDLQRQALAAVDAIGYGREVHENVQGFVRVRIDSLRQGTPGRFFEGGHPLDVEALLDMNVIFEIEDLGDDRDKAFFIGNILIRVFEVLRLRQAEGLLSGGLKHVTVVEEAHRLLQNVEPGSASAQAVTMFANLLAEVRAYGEGIVVAEQIPAKVISDVVKNSAVKIMHRLPAADDREFVGATMNLSKAQSEVVVSLPPGVAAMHVDGMDSPILVAVDGSGASRERRAPTEGLPIGTRSPTCPTACAAQRCTLEQLVLSQTVSLSGMVALWTEIVTLAHLMGEPPGTVGGDVLGELLSLSPDRARCALGLQVDASVDRRSAVIRRFYDPAELKRQVVTVMRRQWIDGFIAPAQDPCWTVASYRWTDVQRALRAESAGSDPSRPHPDTKAWAERGLRLGGTTWAEQRDEVRLALRPYGVDFDSAFLGDPPILAHLCSTLGQGGTRSEQLESALADAGLPRSWPVFRLAQHLPAKDE
jgi:DNA helicase HerA-like ATPase